VVALDRDGRKALQRAIGYCLYRRTFERRASGGAAIR